MLRITEEMRQRKDKWTRQTEEYMTEVGISYEKLLEKNQDEIKKELKSWDTCKWRSEMESKSSLVMYRKYRKEIGGQEEVYDNRKSSDLLFRCRTNNLNLNDRCRFRGEDTKCNICGAETENLNHFLLWCPEYSEERRKYQIIQRPYIEEEENIIGDLLFKDKNIKVAKIIINEIWKKREKKIADIQDN